MNTFIAFIMILVAGADKPITQRMPVDSVEACYEQLDLAAKVVRKNINADAKVIFGCEIETHKADPA